MSESYIPYGRQDVRAEDIEAVAMVLRSDWLTQGPAVPQFEAAVAAQCGAAHAVAVNSATSALHIACAALGLGPGDRLWTSPITFVASANCGRYCGAEVDFVDIDPKSYNMDPEALAEKLAAAERSGTLPKVVVPVDFAGQSCDLRAIHALSERYGFRIVEDASHAVGGSYLGQPIGNGRYSDITILSFHPVKIITTGEGGMALTQDPALAATMQRLRSHGITRDIGRMERPSEGAWYYEQIELGWNYRMTDVQAALGKSQLGRIVEYVARRHELARRYDELLAGLPVVTPWQSPESHSALHLYPIQVAASERRRIFDNLRAANIGVNVHYIPVHTQPDYCRLGFERGQFPDAEHYYAGAISLPMYATLTDEQQDRVVAVLTEAIRA